MLLRSLGPCASERRRRGGQHSLYDAGLARNVEARPAAEGVVDGPDGALRGGRGHDCLANNSARKYRSAARGGLGELYIVFARCLSDGEACHLMTASRNSMTTK